jgi:uncharacterized lipoprotein YmbA
MNKWLPVLFLLTACASTNPKVQYYLLVFDARTASTAVSPVRLSGLTVPEYLGQRGIALRTADNSVQHAQYHRWGEPLQSGIRRIAEQSIDLYSGQLPKAQLKIHIDHLYGTPEGQSFLDAHWVAETSSCKLTGVMNRQLAQPEAGYASMVATQKQLLVDSIGALLQELQQRADECVDQSAQ